MDLTKPINKLIITMHKIKYIAAMLIAGAMCACSDDGSDNSVYIPNAGALVKANFYITDEPDVRTFTVKLTPQSYPDLNPSGIDSDAIIYLCADPEKVVDYNLLHNTDYDCLPEGCFTVSESVKMLAGE